MGFTDYNLAFDDALTGGSTNILVGVWRGTWVSQNYVVNDSVVYNGSSYLCILNTVSNEVPTNATYWVVVANKGDQGPDGDITWKGEWSSSSAYTTNQAVTYEGSSYVTIQSNTNQQPATGGTTYWDVLALKGVAGEPGPAVATQEVSSTSTITRTSATYGLSTSISITPVSGTYLCIFSTTLENSQNGGETYIALFGGGTILQHTERQMSNQSNAVTGTHFPTSTNGFVTVNGSQAIEVRWKQVGGGTGRMFERTLNIMKIA